MISEEYERQHAQRARRSGPGKSKDEDKDEALSVIPGKTKGKERKTHGVCWNCGDKGHYKNKCPKPKKDDSSRKGSTTAAVNAVIESDSDGEGAFFMEDDDDDDNMPDLEILSDSEDDPESDNEGSVWFTDVDEETGSSWDSEELSGVDWSETSSFVNVDLDSDAVESDEYVAQIGATNIDAPRAEIYDSGCSKHLTPYRDALENFVDIPPKSLCTANKQDIKAVGTGEMTINVPNGTDMSQLRLTEVLYSPEVGYTLVSVGRLDEKGFTVTFSGSKCTIQGPNGNHIGAIPKTKGLYRVVHDQLESVNSVDEQLSLDQFHRRMGHISVEVARKLVEKGFVTGVRLEPTPSGEPFFCESCVYAKATRKPVPKVRDGERATKFGEEIHTDLWGPAPIATKGGKKYYITFTDDMSRLTHLYLLRAKSDAFTTYKEYEAWCKTQLDAKIKVLHSDRGGEYLDKEFTLYLKKQGVNQKLTVHDTASQNGVAERRNRTIVERIHALLHASGLPKFLWGEAARHVVWLMNRTSTKAVDGMTPYEAAFRRKPNLKDVREWGEKVWVRVEGGDKLGGRVREGRWMGIDEQSKGVHVYWPDKTTVGVERNVYYRSIASVSRLEGEEGGIIETKTDSSREIPPKDNNSTPPRIPSPPPAPEPEVQATKRTRGLKMGFLSQEGRCRQCHTIQSPPCCPRLLTSSRHRLFRYLRARCEARFNSCCSCNIRSQGPRNAPNRH